MAYAQGWWFRLIIRLVLVCFYVQALNPAMLGYAPQYGLSPPQTEATTGSFGQGLLDWLIPTAQAQTRSTAAATSPVSLRRISVPPYAQPQVGDPLLASTPEFDLADPYIVNKANELGKDPTRIFAFVRDQIGFESYAGSLRGARGTLWSKAGNALDKASLLVALLRASNIPAQYVQGTLADSDAQQLILSMFPSPLRVVGCLDPGTQVADPANDPQLLSEARQHYWARFNGQDADPNFAGAQIGKTFATAQGAFAEVPDNLRHKVTIRLNRELTTPLAGLLAGGASQDLTTILDQTFNTVELVGRSLSIGNFVASTQISAILTSKSITYSPYLLVNQKDGETSDDPFFNGTPYQENITNFPFGSQILTGLFLEITGLFPEINNIRQYEKIDKTIFDKIGFLARQNGVSSTIEINAEALPSLTNLDIITIEVESSKKPPSLSSYQVDSINRLLQDIKSINQELNGPNPSLDSIKKSQDLSLKGMLQSTSILADIFLSRSDELTQLAGRLLLIHSYLDSPRIVTIKNKFNVDIEARSEKIDIELDILKNNSRSYSQLGQAKKTNILFQTVRGLADSALESDLIGSLSSNGINTSSSFNALLQSVTATGSSITLLDQNNLATLPSLNFSLEAAARITHSIDSGKIILAPIQTSIAAANKKVAWLEIDPISGYAVTVLENGAHGAIAEWAKLLNVLSTTQGDLLIAESLGAQAAEAEMLTIGNLIAEGSPASLLRAKTLLTQMARGYKIGYGLLVGVTRAYATGVLRVLEPVFANFKYLGFDPPVGDFLFGSELSTAFLDMGSGNGSGLSIKVIPDPIFTVPLNGALLPTVFRVGIKNVGSLVGTFNLDFNNIPSGFTAQTSIPQITIPPGETAEVGVCLRPTAGLPAPGTNADFGLQATSTTNPAITITANQSFAVPSVSGVTLTSSPTALTNSPGTPVQATLTVQAVGNALTSATLSAELPPGLTLSGLNSVSLAVGETATQTLTLTPAAGTPLNSTLVATLKADFGGAEPQTLTIPVQVAAPGAQSAAEAAVAAGQLGNTDLAARLNDLSLALTSLVQDPNSAVFKGQVLANLDSIIGQVANDPNLAALAASLTNARNALAAATDSSAVLAAVNSVGSALDAFNGAIGGQAQYNFTLGLLPNTQVAQSQTPVPFQVIVQNTGADQATYDLSVSGLPAGVTSQFTPASVTLAPGATTAGNAPILTLTQTSTTQLAAFPFTVTAAVQQSSPPVSRTTQGSLTIRNELVSVASVTANPPFADPGVSVAVSARLLNTVNQSRQVQVSYSVVDGAGQTVLPSSSPVAATLTVQTSLITVDLGALDTTNLAVGDYTLRVTVNDPSAPATPLATGQGSLLIGSPVTASLTLNPDTLPPGNGASAATLQISSRLSAVPPLTLLGQTPIGGATGVAVRNNLAYVCGGNGIHIVDVSNPNLPSVLKTFGSGSRGCLLQGDLLLAIQGFNPSFTVQVYSIKDPQNPLLLGASPTINYNLPFDLQATASHAFVVQFQYCFFQGSNQIFLQTGDLLSLALNLDNPANPTVANPALLKVLFNNNGDDLPAPGDTPGCSANGGNNNIRQMAQADAQTALLASTTATGSVTTGLGRVFSVDISNPAQLNVVNELLIPGTVQTIGVAIDSASKRALVIGSTGGLNSGGDILLTGNLAFTVLDVSNPRAPQILGSRTTSLPARTFWTSLSALGNGLFAFARGVPGANEIPPPQLVLINASDPNNIVVGQPTDTPDNIIGPNAIQTANNLLFATGNTAGLLIYQLGQPPSVPVTAKVQIPRNTGVTAGSFNIQPTQILNGGNFDTLVWDLNFASGASGQTITWQTGITDLLPGESRPVTGDTLIDFTVQGTDAQIVLPPLKVTSQQILALAPTTRTVKPGEAASYTVTVQNPTATAVTYTLAIQGVPSEWVNLASSLTVPPNSAQDVALTLVSDLFAPNGDYGFVAIARVGGVTGSVTGNLTLQGQSPPPPPPPPVADSQARGVVLSISPAQATAGQGTPAFYTARVTNVGSETVTFNLSGNFPTGIQAQFATTQVTLSPGASNFRDVALTLTPSPGAASGSYPFTVTATAAAAPTVTNQTSGAINIIDLGVDVVLSAGAAPQAARTIQATEPAQFTLRVTNTGRVRETYDLALAGPVALYATLAQKEVTLDPGASQSILINVAAIATALPGNLTLIGIATARSNTAVRDSAAIALNVPASRGLTVVFEPKSQTLPAPGPATALLRVQNTGNVESAYQAVITTTTGPISAALEGLAGQPTQRIDIFRLPALATGLLTLDATLQQAGAGQVTVTVTTLDAPALAGADTATITTLATPELKPARVDALLFPYFVVSDTVTSLVSVINLAGREPDASQPQTLHYTFLYKYGANVDDPNALCEEFDVHRTTSPNDLATFDLGGYYGDRLGVLYEPAERQNNANYAKANQSFALMKGLKPVRGFLIVDNWDRPNQPFEGSLAGEMLILDFGAGAAWGYVAYNAAPQTDLSDGSPNDALDTLYPFEDATERMSEILAGSRALTATTLKGGVSPPAPVSLLPSGIEGAITRFFVTPIGHAVTFATGAVANTPVINGRAIVGPRRQTRSDLTTEILLAGDNPNSDTTVAFDRDENPISGQQPRTVTCVGAIDAETLLSEGARREFGEFGGWSAVAVRSPGPLAELSGDPNRPTAARTRNTNQAIVIKLEFRPDGQFLGQPLNSAFNSALWLRQGRRESVATPPSPIRTVPDNRQNRIDVGEDFVGDRLELAPR